MPAKTKRQPDLNNPYGYRAGAGAASWCQRKQGYLVRL
jgi:hypothetical protein